MTKYIHIVKDANGIHQMFSESDSIEHADTNFYDHMAELNPLQMQSWQAYTTIEASDTEKIAKVLAKLEATNNAGSS